MTGHPDADDARDVSYDPERGCYSVEFDPTRDAPSVEIIVAMSTIEDRRTDDIEPLYEVIDPDALDMVFRRGSEVTAERNGRLLFAFNGREVVVYGDGRIDISLTDAEIERERHGESGHDESVSTESSSESTSSKGDSESTASENDDT
ncbi:hypothetical protein AUR64_04510 [Haloprofundus marisrubri]|uniref:Halobacterial output domain-containing protein n=1 Tax=Haloprofundus marisrubri TaxID=1514971 RepID=A0A0W1RCN7_9EURY|nr:HalOD1 output domain-containing protein [Haloprofundus marisrubri]KTG11198.1 hypothetical protein AUR64_04510 [Haloprofundus marisrubri]